MAKLYFLNHVFLPKNKQMKFVVAGSKDAMIELSAGKEHIEWLHVEDTHAFLQHADADAFFNLYAAIYQEVTILNLIVIFAI